MIKILEDLKKLLINILINVINILFKKVENKIPKDLGAKWYGPMEADPRDFKIENVLDLSKYKEVKAKVDMIAEAKPTWYMMQGNIPCCTCASLSNIMAITEDIERGINDTEVKCCELRTELGHKCQANETGDYLEKAIKTLKNNGVTAQITAGDGWSQKIIKLHIDGYAYADATKDNIKKILSAGLPGYYSFRGNQNTWVEMSRGEIKTFRFTATGGHALFLSGYDDKYVYFMNSWKQNDGDKYQQDISTFKITWEGLEEMKKYELSNWRVWTCYLTKNLPIKPKQMFKDYNINKDTEAGKAVKELVNNKIIKGVPHKDGTYLEPGRGITRLEVIVIIYRLIKFFTK